MSDSLSFNEVARLPMAGDNVAIATQRLSAGSVIENDSAPLTVSHTVMEGHRFAIEPIPAGEPLLSWGLPFGVATREIQPGEYVCNPGILEALSLRDLDFALPSEANFEDRIVPFDVTPDNFRAGEQVQRDPAPRTFEGYRRDGRGVGTRNTIVLLGTSSRTGSFVKLLEQRLSTVAGAFDNIDGVVAVAHTEGGESDRPNNYEYVLRTLAGFCTHPNVGAVLAVDYGSESITNDDLQNYLRENAYPLDKVPHRFYRVENGLSHSLEEAEGIVRGWCEDVNQTEREAVPVSELKIALQCGGSDAFSGVSGNPLASWVAREVIRGGGAANLAETDELIGAEAYVLQNASDIETAQSFVDKVEGYKTLASWHGTTAEGNPSGGNKYRGLYNIVLKSIGAAMKRHPDVRLDAVIDYGEPMEEPGFYFMDSPGNDLESIAGQVASGCNMIFFVTGNGSITNFPFVPTLKIITTTGRYELLSGEMDVNAGAYLDGTPMDEVGSAFYDQTLRVASGERSKGELAAHSQVSVWRNWRQTGTENLQQIASLPPPSYAPLNIESPLPPLETTWTARRDREGASSSQAVGLILPTSLCSGQIAQKCAERLNAKGTGVPDVLTRYAALVHTEGCGLAGEETERIYTRSMLNYITHPSVRMAFILEHGCEKTHNDFMRLQLDELGIPKERFGWASIQLDGGIDSVLEMADAWFAEQVANSEETTFADIRLTELRVGISSEGPIDPVVSQNLGEFTNRLVSAGGTIVLPATDSLWRDPSFSESTVSGFNGRPTVPHGGRPEESGLHAMENPTFHWVETLTGLAASGCELILAVPGEHPLQGHPLVPTLQYTGKGVGTAYTEDVDLVATEPDVGSLAALVGRAASGTYVPRAALLGNADFQFTRGLLGVSM